LRKKQKHRALAEEKWKPLFLFGFCLSLTVKVRFASRATGKKNKRASDSI
jgi:hypothetical protein